MLDRQYNMAIDTALAEIAELIVLTEDVYGAIFQQLPQLESEIELTATEVEILLDFFIHQDESERDGESVQQLSRILREVEEEVRRTTNSMVDEERIRHVIDSFLAKDGSAGNVRVENVLEVIYKIKDRITDIELISMNAIIFSEKLGEEGKAFGVISDNIMNFSNKVDKEYKLMEENATALGEWNITFTDRLHTLLEYHKRLTTEQVGEFVNIFKSVFDSLEMIRLVLGELNATVHLAVEPIHELMVKIQIQDILRQGLENVQKCLQALTESNQKYCPDNDCSQERKMNMLAFNQALSRMLVDLFLNIKSSMQESLIEIEAPVNLMHSQLAGLVEDESALSEFFGGEAQETNAIREIFNRVNTFLRDFHKELQELEVRMHGFTDINDTFYEQIAGIERRIGIIHKSVDHLQRLNLMSRIELGRLDMSRTAFVSQIQGITEKVAQEVNKNDEFIAQLRFKLQGDLQQFQVVLDTNIERVRDMMSVVESASEKLGIIQDLIVDSIKPIGTTSVRLYEEILAIHEMMGFRYGMEDRLSKIEENLQIIAIQMQEDYEHGLQEFGLDSWENHSDSLREVLSHFTIHSERVVAQLHLDEQQVDNDNADGELTLF